MKQDLKTIEDLIFGHGHITQQDLDEFTDIWTDPQSADRPQRAGMIVDRVVARQQKEADPAWQEDFKDHVSKFVAEYQNAAKDVAAPLKTECLTVFFKCLEKSLQNPHVQTTLTNDDLARLSRG